MKPNCLRGHPRTPDNLDSRSACKTCKAAWQKAYNETEGCRRARDWFQKHPLIWRRYKARQRLWPFLAQVKPEIVDPIGI